MGIPKKKPYSRKWSCVLNRKNKVRKQGNQRIKDADTANRESYTSSSQSANVTDPGSLMDVVSNVEDACVSPLGSVNSISMANARLHQMQEVLGSTRTDFHQELHELDESNLADQIFYGEGISGKESKKLETVMKSLVDIQTIPRKGLTTEERIDINSKCSVQPQYTNPSTTECINVSNTSQKISDTSQKSVHECLAMTDMPTSTLSKGTIETYQHTTSSSGTIKNYGQLFRNSTKKYERLKKSVMSDHLKLPFFNVKIPQSNQNKMSGVHNVEIEGEHSFDDLRTTFENEQCNICQVIPETRNSAAKVSDFKESSQETILFEKYNEAETEVDGLQDEFADDSGCKNSVYENGTQSEASINDQALCSSLTDEFQHELIDQESDVGSDDLELSNVADTDSNNVDENQFTEAQLDGRRICDISHMFSELHVKFDNHGKHCNNECEGCIKDLRCYKIYDQGMRTQMFFICLKCKYEDSFWTDPENLNGKLTLHESFVCGTLTSGSGYSGGQEALAAMNVRCMSPKIYRKIRENLVPVIKKLCDDEIQAAGILEREKAIEANNKTVQGKPLVTVIGDGVWSKRSYRDGRYDALSGVAVLVSAVTALILFMDVRNKYCLVDARADSLNVEPPLHTCYKNWGRDQASTAMEADIIVSGFNKSLEMHDIIYKTFIGDGDSSTYNSIVRSNPYEKYGVSVTKIECTNHLFRCLGRNLKLASKMTALAPLPKGKITPLRKRVFSSGFYMRQYVVKRIKKILEHDSTSQEKEDQLFNSVVNMTGHFFGDHARCDATFEDCDKTEENMVPNLKIIGMYPKIEKTVDILAANAASLLVGKSTNPAEAYNSILNKLTGGRRINFSLRESYMLRAQLAVLQFNNQNALSKLCQYKGGQAPRVVLEMEEARKKQNKRTAKYRERKVRRRRHTRGTDKHYGVNCNAPDIPSNIYDKRVDDHFAKLKDRQDRRLQIERETVDQVGSAEWQEYRRTMITASKFGQICRMRESTSCKNIVESICYPTPLNTVEIKYGLENEKFAIAALEDKLNTVIQRCGLFIDEKIPYLGATPDGLIGQNELVEVKCLALAEDYTPQVAVDKIPRYRAIFDKKDLTLMNKTHRYYYQVQGQMHIAQKDFCRFALWTPLGIMDIQVARDNDFWSNCMEPMLRRFYEKCLLPEIIDGRRERGMPIRDPDYILEARNRKNAKNDKTIIKKAKKPHRDACQQVQQPDNSCDLITDTSDLSEGDENKRKRFHNARHSPAETPCLDAEWISDGDTEMSTFIHGLGKTKGRMNNPTSRNDAWIEVSDDETREPEEWESEVLESLISSITVAEVIPEIRSVNTFLSDSSIDMFLRILQQNSDIHVYFSHYFPYPHLITPSKTAQDLHIIGGNTYRHWFCMFYDGSNLFAYDSLGRVEYECLRPEEKKYIAKRYPSITSDKVIFQPTTLQPDGTSCGVYAAAFATTIALCHGDPMIVSQIQYSQNAGQMRNHMIMILQENILLPFPTIVSEL